MVNNEIIGQWSSAFFSLVVEEKEVKKYSNEAGILITLFKKYPDFLSICSSSILSFSEKDKIIKETFADFSIYIINLLLFLAQENYFHYSILILKEFVNQCNDYYDIEYGVVYSVIKLNQEQIKKIKKKISILTNKNIELVNKIDESLIAGIKVKVKNQVFDGSIKGQIDQLKSSLLKNSQE